MLVTVLSLAGTIALMLLSKPVVSQKATCLFAGVFVFLFLTLTLSSNVLIFHKSRRDRQETEN
jgi:hypothetical protein